jgi:hypothetical protein
VTESLDDTLAQIHLRIERAVLDAEHELAEMRERCTMLDLLIRSIRAQRSQLDLLNGAEPVPTFEPASGGSVVTIPEAAAEPPVSAEPPASAAAPASVSEFDPAPGLEAPDEEAPAQIEIPTSYMPMLEELWDIARHADDDADDDEDRGSG